MSVLVHQEMVNASRTPQSHSFLSFLSHDPDPVQIQPLRGHSRVRSGIYEKDKKKEKCAAYIFCAATPGQATSKTKEQKNLWWPGLSTENGCAHALFSLHLFFHWPIHYSLYLLEFGPVRKEREKKETLCLTAPIKAPQGATISSFYLGQSLGKETKNLSASTSSGPYVPYPLFSW